MSNRLVNTSRNIVWGTLNKLIAIALPFLVRTTLIYQLGIQYVGISGLFASILQVLSLADLGFANAIVYSMYKPLAHGDNDTVGALLGFYKKIYRVVGAVILIVGLLIVPFINYLVKGSYPADINIQLIYLIYLANTVVSYFLFAYKRSLLLASQRKDISDNIDSVVRIILSGLQILLLFLFPDFYVFALVIPCMTILNNVFNEIVTKKNYNYIVENSNLDKKVKQEIIEKTKGLFVYKVCAITRNSLDNIFISTFLGIATVGIYSNYYYIMISVKGFLDVVSTGMSASVGHSVATESVEKNHRDLENLTFGFSWLATWFMTCLLCLFQPFMLLWVGQANILPFSVVVALCFYFYVLAAGDMRSQYIDASGLWDKEKLRSIAETVGNVVLNYILIQFLGVLGIVLATALTILFIGIPWSTKIVFDNYFKNGYKKYLWNQAVYAIVTIIVASITYLICTLVGGNNIVVLIIRGIICLFVPNILYYLFFLKNEQTRLFFKIIKSKLLK
ncbi:MULTISPECIES: hypothetical protein [Streptococcus]|uniref:lipopolysaccharide biosynthesis protein n=1 Tax=Streptococcus TaxID=1301 RepID=UPI0011073B0F|nr:MULTISPECIES: hypothetical protein [Streptococcus]